METVLLVLLIGGMNLLAFLIGAKTAQKVDRGEEIKLPSINPIEIAKEHREAKEAQIEQDKYNIMLENINNYRGDSTGQKDLPR
jgi:hypothetical protein